MRTEIEKLFQETIRQIQSVKTSSDLQALYFSVLGRKGKFAQLLSRLPNLPPGERAGLGTLANQTRNKLQQAFDQAKLKFKPQAADSADFDPTWPGILPEVGHTHPISAFIESAIKFFSGLGYEVAEGPEVEYSRYNFDLLNIPPNHPSRDLWDTYYLKNSGPQMLLRTQTSPVQIRYMEKHRPPVFIIAPGRTYRHEATDAGHETTFTQIEALAIDKNLKLTDLLGTLSAFFQHFFGNVKIRFRPHYYPFVEPGLDLDMACLLCHGKGCPVCKYSGWLEMLGAGMVHPKVLKNMKVAPNRYSGFAFGIGVERLVMLLYGITDIRLFLAGDLRFLEQFT
ncbi:phenylalanine--tRNA ligase subunit alpha [Candidatus Parcubacteria bacterium]|jgi:phenylalanyl-tRNA synthetase alpha chain|nr:MAG: phenylalanine--tRNA ligase subunit alpha [Candidatus Parcubacteria bacterium]